MAHRRTSSLVLPLSLSLSVPPAASLPPVAVSSSSATSPTRSSTTTTTTMRTLTAVLSRSPSPLPSPVTMNSRERTFSDELENARMHADAPLPDLASFGFDFLAPPSMSMSPPLTPGTPSKLDPGFKPTYGHHGHASSARRPPSSSPVSIVVASIRTTLRRLAFLASSYSAGSSSSSLGGGLPLKSPRSSRSGGSITIPLPLRRRATALALLALLALCAYTVFLPSSSTQVGRVGKGGVRQRVWAADKDKEVVRLDELDPEERRRLLSTAASYRGGAAYGGNVSGAQQQRVKKTKPKPKAKGKPKAKHPLASNEREKTKEETLTLTPADELAALTSFLLNAGSAALDEPRQDSGRTTAEVDDDDDLDPKRPLDPSRVLAFDVARMGAEAARVELEELKRETWAVNPVVVFGKSRHAPTRELRGLLDGMRLQPAPTLFEIDTRVDESILSPLLARLVAATTPRSVRDEFFANSDGDAELELELELPLLLVGGEPVPLRTLMPSFHLDAITYRDDASPDSPDADSDANANANANRKSKDKDTARLAALEALGRKLRAAGAVPQPPKRRKGGK